MNQTSDEHPQFEVVWKGATLEPAADVAPEGDVTLILRNHSEETHDFALVDIGGDHGWTPSGQRVDDDHAALVGRADGIAPGETEALTLPLQRGRYVLVSNSPGRALGTSLFELTVQPVDGR